MLAEEIVDIQAKYETICLNLGKHKGKTLKEIIQSDKGQDYLIWLYKQMKQDIALRGKAQQGKESLDTKEKTPTQKAIMRYIAAVYDL